MKGTQSLHFYVCWCLTCREQVQQAQTDRSIDRHAGLNAKKYYIFGTTKNPPDNSNHNNAAPSAPLPPKGGVPSPDGYLLYSQPNTVTTLIRFSHLLSQSLTLFTSPTPQRLLLFPSGTATTPVATQHHKISPHCIPLLHNPTPKITPHRLSYSKRVIHTTPNEIGELLIPIIYHCRWYAFFQMCIHVWSRPKLLPLAP